MSENILELNGLSVDILSQLSYESILGINLKRDLHYFEKERLIGEVLRVAEWYDEQEILDNVALDYRIKSVESILNKYDRYYPNAQTRKVFNDILGFRALCDSYNEIFSLNRKKFRIADLSNGKAHDDGYRGVHVYFQKSGRCYPIEIQFNTLYDRQLNNWFHGYLYKKKYPDKVGHDIRSIYEMWKIHNVDEFKEALKNVLSGCQK